MNRIAKKKEEWKLLRFKKKNNNKNNIPAPPTNKEPSETAPDNKATSPLSLEAFRVLGAPSFLFQFLF
jgi:hypothetical protein